MAGARACVLVVDPNVISLTAVAGVLDGEGYSCICARSGSAALKALQQSAVDLVVCDVADDAAAALQWLAAVRGRDGCGDLPAVLLADSRWAGLERQAEPLGGVHTLFKPIDAGTLAAVVGQAMWMPHLVRSHRQRGSRPARPGWVEL